MKRFAKYTVFLMALIVLSCSKDGDSSDDIDLYAGQWMGNVTGDDGGTVSFFIYEDGSATGDFFTNGTQTPIQMDGTVDSSGSFSATFSTTEINGSLSGKLSETSGNGTWSITSNQTKGTWSVTKK
ncbi:hypothetical protein [Flagellimonas pelagia]|uniref:Lipocalin-like domain-containing protein n=2 Tax=Flagellimonas pelagia TaxID=2306998 RepID=A0ABY3KIN9_9FLAO|nr:hypothetical protein [Allomuricauda maritima]TXJ95864.1 hypothetical protein FQ017_08240 [Allomuricauda maritima]